MPRIQFHIRPAAVDDVVRVRTAATSVANQHIKDALLQLVRDLATYEKEPESAKATPELFTENIFEKGYAHALLAFRGTAENPGVPLGMALYFFNFSTWTGRPGLYLEDLFVKPEFRNMGIGKALFAELGKVAQEKHCGRVDWSVLTWNEPSIAFYENVLSAKRMDGWMGMRLTEEGIQNLTKFALIAN